MKERRNLRWEEMDKGKIGLNQLVQHFEIFNRSEGKSPKTVKWYSDVLNLFLRWLESEGMSTQIGVIGEFEVRSFILHSGRFDLFLNEPNRQVPDYVLRFHHNTVYQFFHWA